MAHPVAPGNLSKNRQTEFLPPCPAFEESRVDSGGNDVRNRTGKTMGLGKAPLIRVHRDSNVSSDKNQPNHFTKGSFTNHVDKI